MRITIEELEKLNRCKNLGRVETTYKYDEDGNIEVYGNLNLSNLGLTELPENISKVTFNLNISGNKLTSLKGCPEIVECFSCDNNLLTSLEYGPKKSKSYNCRSNKLTSLKYIATGITAKIDVSYNPIVDISDLPKEIYGNFIFRGVRYLNIEDFSDINFYKSRHIHYHDKLKNKLTESDKDFYNYKFNPDLLYKYNKNKNFTYTIDEQKRIHVDGDVDFSGLNLTEIPVKVHSVTGNYNVANNQLKSLKKCAKIISGHFSCANNQLINLNYGPELVAGNYSCRDNKLSNMSGIADYILGDIYLRNNNLTHLLDLLPMKHIDKVKDASELLITRTNYEKNVNKLTKNSSWK